jgi:hypothetical protein
VVLGRGEDSQVAFEVALLVRSQRVAGAGHGAELGWARRALILLVWGVSVCSGVAGGAVRTSSIQLKAIGTVAILVTFMGPKPPQGTLH